MIQPITPLSYFPTSPEAYFTAKSDVDQPSVRTPTYFNNESKNEAMSLPITPSPFDNFKYSSSPSLPDSPFSPDSSVEIPNFQNPEEIKNAEEEAPEPSEKFQPIFSESAAQNIPENSRKISKKNSKTDIQEHQSSNNVLLEIEDNQDEYPGFEIDTKSNGTTSTEEENDFTFGTPELADDSLVIDKNRAPLSISDSFAPYTALGTSFTESQGSNFSSKPFKYSDSSKSSNSSTTSTGYNFANETTFPNDNEMNEKDNDLIKNLSKTDPASFSTVLQSNITSPSIIYQTPQPSPGPGNSESKTAENSEEEIPKSPSDSNSGYSFASEEDGSSFLSNTKSNADENDSLFQITHQFPADTTFGTSDAPSFKLNFVFPTKNFNFGISNPLTPTPRPDSRDDSMEIGDSNQNVDLSSPSLPTESSPDKNQSFQIPFISSALPTTPSLNSTEENPFQISHSFPTTPSFGTFEAPPEENAQNQSSFPSTPSFGTTEPATFQMNSTFPSTPSFGSIEETPYQVSQSSSAPAISQFSSSFTASTGLPTTPSFGSSESSSTMDDAKFAFPPAIASADGKANKQEGQNTSMDIESNNSFGITGTFPSVPSFGTSESVSLSFTNTFPSSISFGANPFAPVPAARSSEDKPATPTNSFTAIAPFPTSNQSNANPFELGNPFSIASSFPSAPSFGSSASETTNFDISFTFPALPTFGLTQQQEESKQAATQDEEKQEGKSENAFTLSSSFPVDPKFGADSNQQFSFGIKSSFPTNLTFGEAPKQEEKEKEQEEEEQTKMDETNPFSFQASLPSDAPFQFGLQGNEDASFEIASTFPTNPTFGQPAPLEKQKEEAKDSVFSFTTSFSVAPSFGASSDVSNFQINQTFPISATFGHLPSETASTPSEAPPAAPLAPSNDKSAASNTFSFGLSEPNPFNPLSIATSFPSAPSFGSTASESTNFQISYTFPAAATFGQSDINPFASSNTPAPSSFDQVNPFSFPNPFAAQSDDKPAPNPFAMQLDDKPAPTPIPTSFSFGQSDANQSNPFSISTSFPSAPSFGSNEPASFKIFETFPTAISFGQPSTESNKQEGKIENPPASFEATQPDAALKTEENSSLEEIKEPEKAQFSFGIAPGQESTFEINNAFPTSINFGDTSFNFGSAINESQQESRSRFALNKPASSSDSADAPLASDVAQSNNTMTKEELEVFLTQPVSNPALNIPPNSSSMPFLHTPSVSNPFLNIPPTPVPSTPTTANTGDSDTKK